MGERRVSARARHESTRARPWTLRAERQSRRAMAREYAPHTRATDEAGRHAPTALCAERGRARGGSVLERERNPCGGAQPVPLRRAGEIPERGSSAVGRAEDHRAVLAREAVGAFQE